MPRARQTAAVTGPEAGGPKAFFNLVQADGPVGIPSSADGLNACVEIDVILL
ncbi:hypothetical protein L6Q96_10580 [Candidatus Binatia bacterium]|nr:hypothetical protein [Candidatus Binatia bacterium]